MVPVECPRSDVLVLITRTWTMGWRVGGSSKGCRIGSAVSLAIWPTRTRRHQKSAAEDDLDEQGHHVRCHVAEPSSRLAKS